MIIQNKLTKFSVIPKELIMDNTLSDRARFVFCWMASMPPEWEFYLDKMSHELGYSIDTTRKYLNELCASGWIVKGEQTTKANGQWGAVAYTINEAKLPCTEITVTEKTRDGKSPTLNNTNNILNTYSSLNTNSKKKASAKNDLSLSFTSEGLSEEARQGCRKEQGCLADNGNIINKVINKEINNKKESVEKELSFVRDDMKDMFVEFLAYRRTIGKPLKPVSYEKTYEQLLELSNNDSVLARKIIDQTIANGWQGLFKLKAETHKANERTDDYFRLHVTKRDPNTPERDDLPF